MILILREEAFVEVVEGVAPEVVSWLCCTFLSGSPVSALTLLPRRIGVVATTTLKDNLIHDSGERTGSAGNP